MKITLVASAIRTQRWMKFYDSLKENRIKYEIVFVGDVRPNFLLPSNFKYIYSPVKPAQCYEIAMRESEGELVHLTSDDAVYAPKALDVIYDYYKSLNTNKLVVGFNCIENGSPTSNGHTIGVKGTPIMYPFPVINRQYLKDLGGYDHRFIVGQGENDLIMRIYEDGGIGRLCKGATIFVEHSQSHDENTKIRKWYPESRNFLEKCWFINGNVSNKRLIPFEPFTNENTLRVSSTNPKGEWQ